jgi:hypothetical protein
MNGAWYAGNPLIVWSRLNLKDDRVGRGSPIEVCVRSERNCRSPFDFAQGRLSPTLPPNFLPSFAALAKFVRLAESRIRRLAWYRDAGNPGPLQSHGTPGQAG